MYSNRVDCIKSSPCNFAIEDTAQAALRISNDTVV